MENEKALSSLDVKTVARKDLKRRASDSYRTQLLARVTKGRKGSLSPFTEVGGLINKKGGY